MPNIAKISVYFPQKKISNNDLVIGHPPYTAQKIYEKTGICYRTVAGTNESAGEMATKAAKKLFKENSINPEIIDYLIFCTQSPSTLIPSESCKLHQVLGLKSTCGAIDIIQGCSGYIYSLSIAKGLIESSQAKRVLVLNADTYTKYLDEGDIGTRAVFGDAATATLIENKRNELGMFQFGTDGSGAKNLFVPVYGKNRTEVGGPLGRGSSFGALKMNGPQIFSFCLEKVPLAIEALLLKQGKDVSVIDYFVFHQANAFMLEALREKLKIPVEKFLVNLSEHGNTVSASIPIVLKNMLSEFFKYKCSVILVGFGVGYSWGVCEMNFNGEEKLG